MKEFNGMNFPAVIPPEPKKMTKEEKKRLIEKLHEIEIKTWGPDQSFSLSHIYTHLKIFPKGMLIAYQNFGGYKKIEPIAWGLVQISKYNLNRPIETWYGATDDGFIVRTHDGKGNWLYGVNLSVPQGISSTVTEIIIQAGRNLVKEKNLRGIILGARIPRYYKFSHVDVEEYVSTRVNNRYQDPELARYHSYGFEIARSKEGKPKILKNYFEDPASLNYGVLMIWRNTKCKDGE